jgi:hypothetical protein
MVIAMSVMPSFIYLDLSPHTHGVIIILCNLQIFSCPTNKRVTRVYYNRMVDT